MSKVFEAHVVEQPFKKASLIEFEVDLLMKGHRSKDHQESQEVTVTSRFLRQVSSRARTNKEKHIFPFLSWPFLVDVLL